MLQTPHSHSQFTYEEENHTYSTFNYSGGCYPYLRWTMDMEAGMRWDFWKDGSDARCILLIFPLLAAMTYALSYYNEWQSGYAGCCRTNLPDEWVSYNRWRGTRERPVFSKEHGIIDP